MGRLYFIWDSIDRLWKEKERNEATSSSPVGRPFSPDRIWAMGRHVDGLRDDAIHFLVDILQRPSSFFLLCFLDKQSWIRRRAENRKKGKEKCLIPVVEWPASTGSFHSASRSSRSIV